MHKFAVFLMWDNLSQISLSNTEVAAEWDFSEIPNPVIKIPIFWDFGAKKILFSKFSYIFYMSRHNGYTGDDYNISQVSIYNTSQVARYNTGLWKIFRYFSRSKNRDINQEKARQ